MIIVKTTLDKPVSENMSVTPDSWDDSVKLSNSPEWRVKSLCVRIISKWNYHSSNENSNNSEISNIKQNYLDVYCLPLIDSCYSQILRARHNYVSPQVIANSLLVIFYGIQMEGVFQAMRSRLGDILLDVALPLLSANGKDEEYWHDDPVQFIYADSGHMDDHHQVRNAAKTLLKLIVASSDETEKQYIFTLMDFIQNCLTTNKNPRTGETVTPLMTECLLYALQVVNKSAMDEDSIMAKLEEFLQKVVFPLLDSDVSVIRARACTVVEKYGVLELTDQNNIRTMCLGICKNMVYPHLVVNVKAAKALGEIVIHQNVRQVLLPELKDLLSNIIRIMHDIELDKLVICLESVVREFKQNIGPFSVDLVQTLINSFNNYREIAFKEAQGKDIDEAHTESGRAAKASLDAIKNILVADLDEASLNSIIPMVLDVLDSCFLEGDLDSLEDSLGFLNVILYRAPVLNDRLIFYYPILCYIVVGKPTTQPICNISALPTSIQKILSSCNLFGNGFEYFDVSMGCFMNFVGKTGTSFLESNDFFGVPFIDLLFEMIRKLGSDCLDSDDDYNLCLSIRLIIALIENFRGKIDHLIPKIIDINSELMKTDRTSNLKSILIQVVCMMFWYNPNLALKLLTQKSFLNGILEAWFSNVSVFTNDFEKERELYGICGLLSLQFNQFPQGLRLEAVAKEVIKVSSEIIKIRENTFKLDEADEVDTSGNVVKRRMSEEDSSIGEIDGDEGALDSEGTHFIYNSPLELTCPILLLQEVLESKYSF